MCCCIVIYCGCFYRLRLVRRSSSKQTGMACLARPISCDHDVHVSERMLDMFGREEMSVSGYPLLKCGCELVELPVSRVYKPQSLTCDEVLPNDPFLSVEEALELIAVRELRVEFERRRNAAREERQRHHRTAMRGFLGTGWSKRLFIGRYLTQFNQDPSMFDNLAMISVRIDWFLLSRIVFPDMGAIGYRHNWCVCSLCYSRMELCDEVQVVNHMYERMEVEFDEHYVIHVGVDMLPQHFIFRAFGAYDACMFLIQPRSYENCYVCAAPLVSIVEPDHLPWVNQRNELPILSADYIQNMSEDEFNRYFGYENMLFGAVPL